MRTSRESSFRRFRLGQWVDQLEDAWLPEGVWAQCAVDGSSIPDGTEVVLGLDGSFSQDCTALVAVTVDDVPHIDVVALWEPPRSTPSTGSRSPTSRKPSGRRVAVGRCGRSCDPFRWPRSMQALEAEGLPVVEFPQSPARMTPATVRMFEAIVNGAFTHSGDARLARHIGNCVLRDDSRGYRGWQRSTSTATRRIDLAVAAVMAHARACDLATTAAPMIYVF